MPNKTFNAAIGVLRDVATPAQWVRDNFFRCPLTGQRQRILDVISVGNRFEIITVGPANQGEQRTGWKHTMQCEEIDPAAEIKKAERRWKRRKPQSQ